MRRSLSFIGISTIGFAILFFSACCNGNKGGNSMGISNDIEEKVESLLSKMTLDEKIGQMNQISAGGNNDMIVEGIKEGKFGSILNEVNPQEVNRLQKVAVEESRLGIPLITSRDVIHGFKTIFPIPLGLAATFNPALVQEGASVAAKEATASGIRWTFSPMLDIARDPRWGRIAEGSGEDPYLNSLMGVAMVKGYQGETLGAPTSMAACLKHYVGYGASIGGRDYNSTAITERELRNIYLPAFEACVDAGAMTIMTSFNDNDGVPSTGNKFILKDVLRDEWGFNGFVVTDWNSAGEMIDHGFAADASEAAQKAITAGVDMDMMSFSFIGNIKNLLKEGKLAEADIDNAVKNILRVKYALGLFDNPYVEEGLAEKVHYAPENLEAAKQTAIESAILLKNNGVLPLKQSVKRVLVTGPMADAAYDQMGTWSFDGDEKHNITPLQAIKDIYGKDVKVIYEPGLLYSRDKSKSNFAKVAAAAKSADVVLAFMGEEAILSGEAHCLVDINLKGAQKEFIELLKKSGTPLVTVVMAGRALTIGEEIENSDALLFSFHPGTMGGPALADIIFGKVSPSGKSPITFPMYVGQIPFYYNRNMSSRPFRGGEKFIDEIPIKASQTSLGNSSYWLDARVEPLVPFGFGLSYTTFEYSNIKLDKESYSKEDVIKVSFTLKNCGKYDAKEVAQVYIRDLVASVTRPIKELKGFDKIFLKAGESKECTIEIPVSRLAFWNIDMQRVVESGDFHLWVGGDSESGNPICFKVI